MGDKSKKITLNDSNFLEFEIFFSKLPAHFFRFEKDKQGKISIVFSEGEIADRFSINTKKVKGKILQDIFADKKIYSNVKKYYNKAFSGRKVDFEIQIRNTWFRTYIHPFKKDTKGDVTEVIGYSVDISDLKGVENKLNEAQERLKKMNVNLERKVEERTNELSDVNRQLKKEIEDRVEAEERYRSLFESSPELIGEFDKDTRIISINPALAKSLNVKPKEVIGKKIGKFIDEGAFAYRFKKGKEALQTNKVIEFEDKRKGRYFHNICAPIIHTDGKKTVQLIAKDITERKKAEMQNLLNMQYLENVIDSASEIIIAFDKNSRIVLWNKTAEELTGFKKKSVLNKKLSNIKIFDNPTDIKDKIKRVCNGKKLVLKNVVVKTKKDENRIIRFTVSPITKQGDDQDSNSCLFIGSDITVDSEYHGRILSGTSYMFTGGNSKKGFDVFKTLTFPENKGLYVTRGIFEESDLKNIKKNIQVLYLKKKNDYEKNVISSLDDLVKKIKVFCKKHNNFVVFLDRLDYLVTNFSFEESVKKLYLINDLISETDSILIVYFDSNIFDKRQIAVFENEFHMLPGQNIEDVDVSNELYDVLKFINKGNENRVLVSFKDVGKKFSIVSKTTSKRINDLEEKGLIYIKKEGRHKTLHVSEKGKRLLNQRKTL